MFVVDEETAAAIRRAWEAGGEPAGVAGPRRRFPLIADTAQAAARARRGHVTRAPPRGPEIRAACNDSARAGTLSVFLPTLLQPRLPLRRGSSL